MEAIASAAPAKDASIGRRVALLMRNSKGFPIPLAVAMVAPLLIGLAVAFVQPVGQLLATSLWHPDFTLVEYQRIGATPLYFRIIARTFLLATTVTVAALLLGYPVALFLARLSGWRLTVATACIMLPLWTSVLVRSYSWIVILQRNGLLNTFLQWLGVINAPLPLLYNELAVVVAMTHVLLPYMILPIWAALRAMPRDLPLAAESLGANGPRVFWHVVLPLSMPGVASGTLMVFILALGFYVTPALVGGPRTLMLATLIGQQTIELLNWPFAGALAAVLLVTTLVLVAAFNRFLGLDKKAAS